jgi:hypothetical protein
MSAGAVGGVGPVPDFEAPGPAAEQGQRAPAEGAEPAVVRGGEAPEAWKALNDTSAKLMEAELNEAATESTGTATEGTEGAEETAATDQVTEPRELSEIEEELAWLEELESMYEEWLEDPELSSYDRYFIEMDLYDVRSEIFDLQCELGQAMADQWWDAFGMLGAGLLGSWDSMISLFQTKSEGMINMLNQQQDIMRRGADELSEADRHSRTQSAIRRAAAESGALVPPMSSEILAILDKNRDVVEQFSKAPSRDKLPELRDAIRELGGGREDVLAAARQQLQSASE